MAYNPRDHYWIVGGSTTQVYSSAAGDFVSVNDPAFIAWKAKGPRKPTMIDTEENLGDVLAPYQLRPTPVNVLEGYKTHWSEEMAKIFQMLLATQNMDMENRIRALERATGIVTPPPPALTNQQIKQFIKSKV